VPAYHVVGRPSCLPSCLLGWCWRVQLWRTRGGQTSASPSLACRRPRADHSKLPLNESKRGVNPTYTEPQPDGLTRIFTAAIYRCCESTAGAREVRSFFADRHPFAAILICDPPPVFSGHGRSLTPPTTTLVSETPLRYPSLFFSVCRSVSVCLSVFFLFVLSVCLCLPVHQAWGEAPAVMRVHWTVVCGVRPPGELLWPCPFHRSPSG